jgi:hypothetical protein
MNAQVEAAPVHHVVVVPLRRGVDRPVVRVAQEVLRGAGGVALLAQHPGAGFHRLDGGARVAGHLDLGDHLDVPGGGMAQDLGVVRTRVEAAAPRVRHVAAGAERRRQVVARVERVAASRADGRQLGQARVSGARPRPR